MNPKTIEELLDMPGEVEKLSDLELEKHLARYFPHTRPTARLATALSVALDKADAAAPKNEVFDAMERRIQEEYERNKAAAAAAKPRSTGRIISK